MNFIDTLRQCATLVDNELEKTLHYTESNYQTALIHFLKKKLPNSSISREVHINYKLSCGTTFGSGRADIICEDKDSVWVLELKANSDYKWMKKFTGQTERYVRHFKTDKNICGILVLFGNCTPILKVLP